MLWRLSGSCVDNTDAYDSQRLPRHGARRDDAAWELCAQCPVLRACAEQTAAEIESGRLPIGVVVAGVAYHDFSVEVKSRASYRVLEQILGRRVTPRVRRTRVR